MKSVNRKGKKTRGKLTQEEGVKMYEIEMK